MSNIFNYEIPLKEKPVPPHPWDKSIKGEFPHYKYGHLTAKNPITNYPPTKDKISNRDLTKFTIIGNRLTEEFIYCVHLVNGLHKFRGKTFAAPIIQGLSCVEWDEKWRDLKIRYGGLAYCLQSQVAVLMNEQFLGGMPELKELIEAKYAYYIRPDYHKEAIKLFASYIKSSGRPCAYMQISIDEKPIGTLIFMLYSDIVPRTCENFLRLCTATKGGYSGTPIHRIVKDCWIQGGGFALKNTDLECENFIVPHDKRGVLAMANDGRHLDCSTQFFVLLQPAPWMASKYVAFGKLIDGEETLKKIEAVETWWESPKQAIKIYNSGLFNMDCQYMPINKMTNEYIQGHIENLATLGTLFYELVLEKVFLTTELREIQRMQKDFEVEGEHNNEPRNIRTTERFIRRREEIDNHLQKTGVDIQNASPTSPIVNETRGHSVVSEKSERNNEFDVEVYSYEPEEYSYKQTSMPSSSVAVPEKPYYIALTDVPYPGEVSSVYNLQKMLRGDYCLQDDLDKKSAAKRTRSHPGMYQSEVFQLFSDHDDDSFSMDSEDARNISDFFKDDIDKISFAGLVIRNIAKSHAKTDIFKEHVSLSVPLEEKPIIKISRRQTGFIRPEDVQFLSDSSYSDDFCNDGDDNSSEERQARSPREERRSSGPAREWSTPSSMFVNQSTLNRLFANGQFADENETGPTLKDFKPKSDYKTSTYITISAPLKLTGKDSAESLRHRMYRRRCTIDNARSACDRMLEFQHGAQVNRKVSSDYVRTIERIEKKAQSSIRTIEFAKTRPFMSVHEYREKNQASQDARKEEMEINRRQKSVKSGVMYKKLEDHSKSSMQSVLGKS